MDNKTPEITDSNKDWAASYALLYEKHAIAVDTIKILTAEIERLKNALRSGK